MNSTVTANTITPSAQNPKQPQQRQTANEIIAANVKCLIEQLEAGHSDALTPKWDAAGKRDPWPRLLASIRREISNLAPSPSSTVLMRLRA